MKGLGRSLALLTLVGLLALAWTVHGAMWGVPAGRPQAYAPGQHIAYSSGDTVFASYLWQRSLDAPYPRWIDEHFSRPLGIRSLVAEADASADTGMHELLREILAQTADAS